MFVLVLMLIHEGNRCRISYEVLYHHWFVSPRLGAIYDATLGHVQVLSMLVKAGQDPEGEDVYGQTPLHLAALRGNRDSAEYLVIEVNLVCLPVARLC